MPSKKAIVIGATIIAIGTIWYFYKNKKSPVINSQSVTANKQDKVVSAATILKQQAEAKDNYIKAYGELPKNTEITDWTSPYIQYELAGYDPYIEIEMSGGQL